MTIKLGKLKQIGITKLVDVALYMPTDFIDYRHPVTDFNAMKLLSGSEYVFKCALVYEPNTKFKSGRPQTSYTVTDGQYLLQFTLFGDTRAFTEHVKSRSHFYVHGTLSCMGSGVYINNAVIVDEDEIGHIKAVYPGVSGKLKSSTVSKLIAKHIDAAIPLAAEKLRSLLYKRFGNDNLALRRFLQCPKMTLIDALNHIHSPTSLEQAYKALDVMQKIALLSAADTLIEKAQEANIGRYVEPVHGWPISRLVQRVPFQLTGEQLDIIQRQIESLQQGKLLNLLIIGDVGTGKTVVYGAIAGYMCSAGKRVSIMLPNGRLAEQIHAELSEYYPEFKPLLINGDCDYSVEAMQSCSLLIGTSALLFREVGQFDLVVIDEQQKLSSAQRLQLVGENTSSIEVSATPIPRTLALAQYGAVKIEYIKHCHVLKTIDTFIMQKQDANQVMQLVIDTVNSGNKVLIVCPKRDLGHDDSLTDAETVASQLDAILPNRVCLAHSGLTDEANAQALADIKDKASVLVSTVIVEVGITIPKLTLAIVMHAERFGLTQLHQIRGRLVRSGGYGMFILYLPKPPKSEKSIERMQSMCEISDGYELSMRDLQLRGVGDLDTGITQHGAYSGHIRNLHIDVNELEKVVEAFV